MTAPWWEESTAGVRRDPRPTPFGQPGVKNAVPRPLPRPRILHLGTDATKPTRISELQQRFPLAPLRGSLLGRSGGCSRTAGEGCGLGDSPTHGHGCPKGRGPREGVYPFGVTAAGKWRRRGRQDVPGGKGSVGLGSWGNSGTSVVLPRYRGSFLRLPGAGSRHRSHAGGREAPAPGPRLPSGLDLRLAPPGTGGSRPQTRGPGESLWLPAAAPSALRKVVHPGAVLTLGPFGTGGTQQLSPADFPFRGQERRGKSCDGCDLCPPPRGRAPDS